MDDYENDGRDYSEIIDEGPIDPDAGTTGLENEGWFGSSSPSKGCPPKKPDTCPEKKSSEQKKCKPKSKSKSRSRSKSKKSCVCKPDKSKSRGSGKKKIPNLINPFIIFYLEMYFSNPHRRVVDVAREAGKKWCSMSEKEKAGYIKKARAESAKRNRSKKGQGKC